nr:hypothetical protein [uncultured Actinotalea sp.]
MGAPVGVLGTAPVAAAVALLATVDPEDGLRPDLEPTDVTPGVVGFAVTALVVAGLIGLLLSMVVKLRRVNLGTERPAPPWASGTDTAGSGGVGGDDVAGAGGAGAGGTGADPGAPGVPDAPDHPDRLADDGPGAGGASDGAGPGGPGR